MKQNTILWLAVAGIAGYLLYQKSSGSPYSAPALAPYLEHPISDAIGDIIAPIGINPATDLVSLMPSGPLQPLKAPIQSTEDIMGMVKGWF